MPLFNIKLYSGKLLKVLAILNFLLKIVAAEDMHLNPIKAQSNKAVE